MAQRDELPGIERLQAALSDGDITRARKELLALSERERRVLAEEMGPAALRPSNPRRRPEPASREAWIIDVL